MLPTEKTVPGALEWLQKGFVLTIHPRPKAQLEEVGFRNVALVSVSFCISMLLYGSLSASISETNRCDLFSESQNYFTIFSAAMRYKAITIQCQNPASPIFRSARQGSCRSFAEIWRFAC